MKIQTIKRFLKKIYTSIVKDLKIANKNPYLCVLFLFLILPFSIGSITEVVVLSDNFNDNSVNATIWNNAGACSETGGEMLCNNDNKYIFSQSLQGLGFNTSQPFNLSVLYKFTDSERGAIGLGQNFSYGTDVNSGSFRSDGTNDCASADSFGFYISNLGNGLACTPRKAYAILGTGTFDSSYKKINLYYNGTEYFIYINNVLVKNSSTPVTNKINYFGFGDWESNQNGNINYMENFTVVQYITVANGEVFLDKNITSNVSIFVNWTTTGTYDTSVLKRNGAIIYNGSQKNFTDTGLNPDTTYNYNLSIYYTSTLQDYVEFSLSTDENAIDTAQEIRSLDERLSEVENMLEMIPLVILYAVFLLGGIWLLLNKNTFYGIGLIALTIGFDFLLIREFVTDYVMDSVIRTGWQLTFTGIFAVSIVFWIIVKLSMPIFIKYTKTGGN